MITATKIAEPKEEKAKLCGPKRFEVMDSINPFTTKVNNPRERIFRGRDKMIRNGRIKPFKIDRIKAASNAVTQLFT